MKTLAAAIQDMVLEHPSMSAAQITEKAFGVDDNGKPIKPTGTLYRELNPDDDGAKLGVFALLKLMEATGCYRPLEIMASLSGFHIVSMHECAPDGANMEEELLQGYQAMARFVAAEQAGASSADLAPLCEAVWKECKDVVHRKRDEEEVARSGRPAA